MTLTVPSLAALEPRRLPDLDALEARLWHMAERGITGYIEAGASRYELRAGGIVVAWAPKEAAA